MEKNQLLKPIIILIEATILSTILSIVIIAIDLELLLKIFYPIEIPIPAPYNYFGAIFIIIGFILLVWANYILLYVNKIGLKDREPFHVPSSLALTGPYKFTRNPIYLGAILMAFGVFILVQSITVLIITVLLFFLFRFSFIKWEEKKLEEEFGQDYLNFKQKVRRWI
ncbi:MAG: methyltransferase family protein [Candidatus Hodarchaeales archaeon]